MNTPNHLSRASQLIGANPKGAVSRVSLAVKSALQGAGVPGAIVCVALSGGADSLALLAASIDVAGRLGMPVHALTVDHKLRPESTAESQRVAALAKSLGATDAQVLQLGAHRRIGPEGGAREGRYAALNRTCRVLSRAAGKPCLLLLGHTMDDQAETVLLGLGRGSGLRSLAGMAPIVDPAKEGEPWLLRPLLQIRRNDTVLACKSLGLEPIQDPSNRADGPWRSADGSALRRAAVREFALPALAGALGKDPTEALMRTATQMRRDNDCLDQAALQLLQQVTVSPGKSTYTGRRAILDLDWHALAQIHSALVTRVVRLAALDAGATPAALSSVHIDALAALVLDYRGQGPVYLPGGVVGQRVRLDKPTEKGRPGLTVPAPNAPVRLRFS